MTPDEYKALPRQKRSKYGNRKTVVDGATFDSEAEARRYWQLKLLQRAGKIQGLEIHKRFKLHAGIVYECDFFYSENFELVAEDVKGKETDVFRLKARLFREDYPDVELRVIPAREV